MVRNWSWSDFLACSGTKSHDGRGVTGQVEPTRSARAQGVSRQTSETSTSAGLSRAISSTSSVRETPVSEKWPVDSSTQARPSLPRTSTMAAR